MKNPEKLGNRRICLKCVSEPFLKKKVRAQGIVLKCSFCGVKARTFGLKGIADLVEQVFESHFERTSCDPTDDEALLIKHADDYFWGRDGEPVDQVIAEVVGVEQAVAEAIAEFLAQRHFNFELATMGEESSFSSESHYRPKSTDPYGHHYEAWSSFERSLHAECRFFSRTAQRVLDEIFQGIESFLSRDGEPLVREIGPGTEVSSAFRARVFQSIAGMEHALMRPDLEIGPPPGVRAAAGRMNAQGISVFYGASHPDTALAEVRPPVGASVVIGEFEIIRPVRILDLRKLGQVLVQKSYFDPDCRPLLERAAFLRQLSERLILPAMPEREHRDYLVTQVFADYLASKRGLDGVIFPSVQTQEGFNLVLFHHAARTEEFDIPAGTEISVSPDGWEDDGPSPDYRVVETRPLPAEIEDQSSGHPDPVAHLGPIACFDSNEDPREPVLRLTSNVFVRRVRAVSYHSSEANVSRSKIEGKSDFS